ncbi:MAG: polymerase chi subunit, HolC family protein [Micavibrio sp.]|nr:polymerase chi subunit, HolC family protein [Micavibrio sp.]
MTEIRFYHLTTRSIDSALPEICARALSAGHRVLVCAGDEAEVERLTNILWTSSPLSFLPHGSKKDGRPEQQPIWMTAGNDNPNAANVMIVTSGATPDSFDGFTLFCDLFDGRDETMLASARQRWKAYKDGAHSLTYWQQTEKGWEQKA